MRKMLEWVAVILTSIDKEKISEDARKQIKMRASILGENRMAFDLIYLLRLLHEYELYHLAPSTDEVEMWFKSHQVR